MSTPTTHTDPAVFPPATHTDPAVFTLRDLERSMVRSRRMASQCRQRQDAEQAELHTLWMDILLDEWARRQAA